MLFQPVILWTDFCFFLLIAVTIAWLILARHNLLLLRAKQEVARRPVAMFAAVILMTFVIIAFLDSLHFHPALPSTNPNQPVFYSTQVKSVLDVLIYPLGYYTETTYSAPFAVRLSTQSVLWQQLLWAMIKAGGLFLIIFGCIKLGRKRTPSSTLASYSMLTALALVLCVIFSSLALANLYHVLGTDKVGNDVYYQTVKSIRTGLLIGTLTTLFMLPLAIFFGLLAGYFRSWVDDIIQYIYITLSSIPAVLLITAAILSLQIFIKNHPQLLPNTLVRADCRLLILCAILGITSWTDLCRLLRGESLKLREMEYTQAANMMGVTSGKIILKHILPNVMHIILITVALDFSALVLAEAVLSYVGVGVDPTTFSWGNMINSARLELAREPIVWWPLTAAFIFMFCLVLSANLFADALRDALDPRTVVTKSSPK